MNLNPEEQNLDLEPSSPSQESQVETGDVSSNSASAYNFSDSPWEPEVRECMKDARWESANALQAVSIPVILTRKDVFIQSADGTAGVIFPTISDRILKAKRGQELPDPGPYAAVLYSNQALTKRAFDKFKRLFGKSGLSAVLVSEEEAEWEDAAETLRMGCDLLFSTPEALRTFYVRKRLRLKHAVMCVCVDVDDSISKGLEEELEFLLSRFSEGCQKILFSSTTSAKVKELAFEFLNHPEHVTLVPETDKLPELEQHALLCETPDKFKVLLGLLKEQNPGFALVFANSKLTASWLHHKLQENQYAVELINAELPQTRRVRLLKEIKTGNTKILVTTDRTSHDLHVADVTHIYNFDVPESPEDYLERLSRMGKSEQPGLVCTLVCDQYGEFYEGVQDLLGAKAPKPRWHKEEYLSITDKSGNPFMETQEREFRGPSERPQRSIEPSGERTMGQERSGERTMGQERSGERDRPWQDRPRSGERQERSRGEGMRTQGERRPSFQRGERPGSGAPQSRDRDRQQIRPRSRRALPQQYKRIEKQAQFEKPAESKSLLKRIFSLFSSKKD